MLISTVAITVLIAVGVVAWTAVRGGEADSDTPNIDWDEIAVVDRATGAISTYDRDGEQLVRATGSGRVLDVHAHGDRLALVGSDAIVITDPTGDTEPETIDIPRGSIVSPIETASTMHLLVGHRSGGNLLIIDVAAGTVIDVGAAAAPTVPKLFVETVRVDADGTTFAVADAANFQTIVVGESIEGAAFLADQPIAVGAELIAVSQVVNLQADISLVDLERRREAVVTTDLPRGATMVDGELVMVSVDGGVFRVRPDADEAERIGDVPVGTGSVAWAVPSYLGERLVVGGTGFAAVIDLDGTTVFSTTFATASEPLRPHPAWRCWPVTGTTGHSLVALGTGEQLADLTGLTITGVAADGCTVVGERGGVLELVNPDGSVRLDGVRNVVLAPDGDSVVWTTTTGRTEYVTLSDELDLEEPVELTDVPTSRLVTFLRR